MSTNEVIRRHIARAILLDPFDRVLLFYLDASRDPRGRGYWYLPGGGIHAAETAETAVTRELREEAGIETIEVGARLIHLNGVRFEFAGRRFEQDEWHIAARASSSAVGTSRIGDLETDAAAAHRWWSLDELASSTDTIYPVGLEVVVRAYLSGEMAAMPLELEDQAAQS